jgi:hypothetical protein
VLALLAGCASMPTSSQIFAANTAVTVDGSVGFIAAGPERGQGPEAVVRGFLLAAQSGPTMTNTFAVAREFLSPEAAGHWWPTAAVHLLDGVAALEVIQDEQDARRAVVHATGRAVGEVSAAGEYTDFRYPLSLSTNFHLEYDGQNWRITELDDGLLLPAQVFAAAYRQTRLYHPSADLTQWVPDLRWFPQQTWRTNAAQALIAGPPAFLRDAVAPVVPETAAVTVDGVVPGPNDTLEVMVQGWLRDADPATRALFAAQLATTFTDGNNPHAVSLIDTQGLIPIPELSLPALARTQGSAFAIKQGNLYQVAGRNIHPVEPEVRLDELNVTALAVAPGDSEKIVVRSGANELWGLTLAPVYGPAPGEEILDAAPDYLLDSPSDGVPESDTGPLEPGVPGRTLLLVGENLAPPSIDRFGKVWTAELAGAIIVVDAQGIATEVAAPWLDDEFVERVAVAPDGARLALIIRDADGTRILVAGVVRDANHNPVGLAQPKEVGATVRSATDLSWQGETVLAVVGRRAAIGGVYLVGVGGLDSPGGLPRHIPGIEDPLHLTAAVGSGNMLAIDPDRELHLREATSLWPIVGTQVDLVAYPG